MSQENSKTLSLPIIAMITLNMISTSVIVTFSQPFLPEMIRYFGYAEYQKGYFAGLTQTAFYTGRIFGSVIIGRVADRMSKYRLFIWCLALSAIFTTLFGLALNIYFVIIMKLCIGLVSGTALLGKVIVFDLCTNESQSIGMMFHMIGVTLGTVIAFNIGGNLQNPAQHYRGFESSFLQQYPYLLCSLVVVAIITINIILLYFVEKSIKTKLVVPDPSSTVGASPKESTLRTYIRIFKCKKIIIVLGIYMLFSLCAIGTDELLIVYISTEVNSGGLGLSTRSIGNFLMYCAIPSIIVHLLVFTTLVKRIGLIGVLKSGASIVFPVTMLIPLSYLLLTRSSPKSAKIFIYIEYIIIKSINNMLFGPIGLLLNNAANFDDIGTVNGIGLSLSCLSRSIAPVLFDSIYASTIKVKVAIGPIIGALVSFSFVSFFLFLLGVMTFFVPKSLNSRRRGSKTTPL